MTTRTDVVVTELQLKTNQLTRELRKTNQSLQGINKSTKAVTDSLRSMATVAGFAGFATLAKDIIGSTIALSKLDNNLKAVTKTTTEYQRAMSFLTTTSDDLGLSMRVLEESYTMYYASAQAAGLVTADIDASFTAVATSAKAFSLSAADMEGAMLGLRQMANSSSVSLEDLRQVTDRIPGGWKAAMDAIRAMAGDLDMTDDSIKKLISSGRVATKEMIPQFTQTLMTANKEIADSKTDDLASSVNRLNNAFDEIKRTLIDNGVIEALASFVEWVDRAVKAIPDILYAVMDLARQVNGLPTLGELDQQVSDMLGPVTELPPIEVTAPKLAPGGIRAAASGRRGGGGGGGGGGKSAAQKAADELKKLEAAYKSLEEALDPYLAAQRKQEEQMAVLNDAMAAKLIPSLTEYDKLVDTVRKNAMESIEKLDEARDKVDDDVLKQFEDLKSVADELGNSAATAFAGMVTGAEDVNNSLANVLDSLASMILQLTVIKPLAEAVSTGLAGNKAGGDGGLFGFVGDLFKKTTTSMISGALTSANGNAFGGGTGLSHGVYSAPTTFPINGPSGRFAMGTGLLGEAGPEAVLPLSRGPGGKLGVMAEGSGTASSVTIINNAPGVDVSAQQGLNPRDLEIVVAKVSSDISRGGSSISRSIEGTYALKRGSASR